MGYKPERMVWGAHSWVWRLIRCCTVGNFSWWQSYPGWCCNSLSRNMNQAQRFTEIWCCLFFLFLPNPLYWQPPLLQCRGMRIHDLYVVLAASESNLWTQKNPFDFRWTSYCLSRVIGSTFKLCVCVYVCVFVSLCVRTYVWVIACQQSENFFHYKFKMEGRLNYTTAVH